MISLYNYIVAYYDCGWSSAICSASFWPVSWSQNGEINLFSRTAMNRNVCITYEDKERDFSGGLWWTYVNNEHLVPSLPQHTPWGKGIRTCPVVTVHYGQLVAWWGLVWRSKWRVLFWRLIGQHIICYGLSNQPKYKDYDRAIM